LNAIVGVHSETFGQQRLSAMSQSRAMSDRETQRLRRHGPSSRLRPIAA
jgi:hypothetical protein